MGLGLHGGGATAARFLAERGCEVTVTDLRDETTLAPSIADLEDLPIRFVLGRHECEDFDRADLIVKNPAVRRDSPFLKRAKAVETDISLFLKLTGPRVIAVTGSKGKSMTASAIHHALVTSGARARLGGNITTSPLGFFEEIDDSTTVVLELSSWQLADLSGMGILDPEVSVSLNILRDHQNRYADMAEYAADKRAICEEQSSYQVALLNYDDETIRAFAEYTGAKPRFFSASKLPGPFVGGWLDGDLAFDNLDGETQLLFEGEFRVPGNHNRFNMLAAAVALSAFGVERRAIAEALRDFGGIRHRLETVGIKAGVTYINDTAATIPDATVAASTSYSGPVHLIAGGADKSLDFSVLRQLSVASLHLIHGSGTSKMVDVLNAVGIEYSGPFRSFEDAFESARNRAEAGSSVVLSPGCTSFEMFHNEFERGDAFVAMVKKIPD